MGTLRKRAEARRALNPEDGDLGYREEHMCQELEVPLSMTSQLRFSFLGSGGKKLEKENKARSPQAQKLLGAAWAWAWGLWSHQSSHEACALTCFSRAHSGNQERDGFEWAGLKTGRRGKKDWIMAGGGKEMHGQRKNICELLPPVRRGERRGKQVIHAESGSSALDR